MPVPYKSGDIATFRNIPTATRAVIDALSLFRHKTQGEVIVEAIKAYAKSLMADSRLPKKWDSCLARFIHERP